MDLANYFLVQNNLFNIGGHSAYVYTNNKYSRK